MKKMRTFFGILLAVMLILCAVPALAYTTEDVDIWFAEGYYEPRVTWQRTSYGRGAAADIYEEARLDGYTYSFRAMSDGSGVAEVALTGWFEDLQMQDADFPLGLQAFNNCILAVDKLVPSHDASYVFSPYDIYDILKAGRFYDYDGIDNWTITEIQPGRIEVRHDSGCYLIMSVYGSTFNFLYTAN